MMKKSILNLGKVLNKKEQKSINGGDGLHTCGTNEFPSQQACWASGHPYCWPLSNGCWGSMFHEWK